MRIEEPNVELWLQEKSTTNEFIAKCASTCYNSPLKLGNKADTMVKALKNSNHLSVLRHSSYYYILPYNKYEELPFELSEFNMCPYVDYAISEDNMIFMATNGQFVYENRAIFEELLSEYRVSHEVFKKAVSKMKEEFTDMLRYTMCITTQISTSRELARHSPQNYTEASTRYINMGDNKASIVRPHWLDKIYTDEWSKAMEMDLYPNIPEKIRIYLGSCVNGFANYDSMLDYGYKPEDARGVLPLDTKTTVIMTHSIKEWKKIIAMRYYNSTGKAHPNIKIIAGLIKEKLQTQGYNI